MSRSSSRARRAVAQVGVGPVVLEVEDLLVPPRGRHRVRPRMTRSGYGAHLGVEVDHLRLDHSPKSMPRDATCSTSGPRPSGHT